MSRPPPREAGGASGRRRRFSFQLPRDGAAPPLPVGIGLDDKQLPSLARTSQGEAPPLLPEALRNDCDLGCEPNVSGAECVAGVPGSRIEPSSNYVIPFNMENGAASTGRPTIDVSGSAEPEDDEEVLSVGDATAEELALAARELIVLIGVIGEKAGAPLVDRFLATLAHDNFVLGDMLAATGDCVQDARVSVEKKLEKGTSDRGEQSN